MTDLPFRIGQAVDVHAFAAPDSQRTLMLACLEWAGASGRAMLQEVRRMATEAGWVLGNATVQVVGNRPRMAARLPEADTVMSEIAGGTVTVSATTSDRLGFTGRGEGVAALASVLMVRVAPASN